VPEATTVDQTTRNQLQKAKEKDLYLSNVSPLGVPFNNLRNASKEVEKFQKIEENKPGSPCPRGFLALGNEYGTQGICTASRLYQKNKIEEEGISDNITDKSCLCMGLAATAVINHGIQTKESKGVSICPGPNMAYFDKQLSLQEMSYFIYKGAEKIVREDRPNIFVKELELYMHYFSDKVNEHKKDWGRKSEKYLSVFNKNMNEGILYYQKLFSEINTTFSEIKENVVNDLQNSLSSLKKIGAEIDALIQEHK
jgi:hypothetical protein